jgi:hypothetical protein
MNAVDENNYLLNIKETANKPGPRTTDHGVRYGKAL